MKIGDRIRITRKINKMTIKELAKILDISVPTYKKIEKNLSFVNMIFIKKLINLGMNEKELLKYYYKQELKRETSVKVKNSRVYIIIPKDISIAFGIEENREIFCCYLNNKMIIQRKENDHYFFEKKKFLKNSKSFILFLGQKLKDLQGKIVNLSLDLKNETLVVTY